MLVHVFATYRFLVTRGYPLFFSFGTQRKFGCPKFGCPKFGCLKLGYLIALCFVTKKPLK